MQTSGSRTRVQRAHLEKSSGICRPGQRWDSDATPYTGSAVGNLGGLNLWRSPKLCGSLPLDELLELDDRPEERLDEDDRERLLQTSLCVTKLWQACQQGCVHCRNAPEYLHVMQEKRGNRRMHAVIHHAMLRVEALIAGMLPSNRTWGGVWPFSCHRAAEVPAC